MGAPLWTETYMPRLDDLPQPKVRDHSRRAVNEPMNLVVQGPPGVGKTVVTYALARGAHTDSENDLIELNVADFFNRTGKQIRADLRFKQFLDDRSRMAKRDMINYVFKESTDYALMPDEYKTIVLDNAELIREDSQQAPRRVMEQRHRTTQFIITTCQLSRLIPSIRSQCFPAPMPTLDNEAPEAFLADTLDARDANYDVGGLQFLTDASNGNVRKAVLSAQRTTTEADEVTVSMIHATLGDVGLDDGLKTLLTNARGGDIKDARKTLTTLLDDGGYEGQELLADIPRAANSIPGHFADGELARLHELVGQVDLGISASTGDRLHIIHLLASWDVDVHGEA